MGKSSTLLPILYVCGRFVSCYHLVVVIRKPLSQSDHIKRGSIVNTKGTEVLELLTHKNTDLNFFCCIFFHVNMIFIKLTRLTNIDDWTQGGPHGFSKKLAGGNGVVKNSRRVHPFLVYSIFIHNFLVNFLWGLTSYSCLPTNEQPKTYCLLFVKISECTHLCTIKGRKKWKKFQEKINYFWKNFS